MDKVQADLAKRMQHQSEEFQAQKQLQQPQFEKHVLESSFETHREVINKIGRNVMEKWGKKQDLVPIFLRESNTSHYRLNLDN
jgi:hypothetical protein